MSTPGHVSDASATDGGSAAPAGRPTPSPTARRLARAFGLDADALTSLGAFESEVVAGTGPHGPTVLKVVAPDHRARTEIEAEVAWVRALHASGVPVAEPFPSREGRWTEVDTSMGDGEPHVGVAFRRAPGRTTGPSDWTAPRLERWGELAGRLQAHGRAHPGAGAGRRTWREQSYLARAESVFEDDAPAVRAATALRERMDALPRAAPGAGPIHADLHHGNVLLDGERWTAIDFDDAVVGPYAFDLAMPLYYAVAAIVAAGEGDGPEVRASAADTFLTPFLRGFRRHAPDPEGGADAVAASLAIRRAELAVVLRVKLDPVAWTERQARLAATLRDGLVAGDEVVPLATLRRHLPG